MIFTLFSMEVFLEQRVFGFDFIKLWIDNEYEGHSRSLFGIYFVDGEWNLNLFFIHVLSID